MASLKEMPDLSNNHYFWRSVRLASALALSGIWIFLFDLNPTQAAAFFISTLFLSIVDMSASVATRLKMLLISLASTMLVGAITILLYPYFWSIFFFIPVVVFGSLYGARVFPIRNLFLSINLLAFVLALPFTSEKITLIDFSLCQFFGGLWYFSTVLFGLAVFNFLKWIGSQWADYFYLNESYANPTHNNFIIPTDEQNNLIRKENEGESHFFFKHPFRLIVSLLIGLTIMNLSQTDHGYWIVLTIIFIHHPSKKINASIPKMVQRFLGTLIGLILFFPLTFIEAGNWVWHVITFFVGIPIFLFLRSNYFIAIIFVTILVMLNMAAGNGVDASILLERCVDTIMAILIVLSTHFILRWIKFIELTLIRKFK